MLVEEINDLNKSCRISNGHYSVIILILDLELGQFSLSSVHNELVVVINHEAED